jgi:hypothetical protein
LAVAGVEFEKQLGASLTTQEKPPAEPAADATATDIARAAEPPDAPAPVVALAGNAEPAVNVEGPAPEEQADSNLVELDLNPGTRVERRRIRDLIRQVRSLPDEAS